MSEATVEVLRTLGPPAAWAILIVGVLAVLSWIYQKLQAGITARENALNESQKLHQNAVEATFAMYQSQLNLYKAELESARERIAHLEGVIEEMRERLRIYSEKDEGGVEA